MTREPQNQPFHDAFQAEQTVPGSVSDVDAGLTTLREMAALQLLYGQPDKAERFMTIALWIRPEDGRSMRMMAHAKARKGHAVEAAKLLLAASDRGNAGVQFRDWKEVGLALLKGHQRKLGARFLKRSRAPLETSTGG